MEGFESGRELRVYMKGFVNLVAGGLISITSSTREGKLLGLSVMKKGLDQIYGVGIRLRQSLRERKREVELDRYLVRIRL